MPVRSCGGVVLLVGVVVSLSMSLALDDVGGAATAVLGARGALMAVDAQSGDELWRVSGSRESFFDAQPGRAVTVATSGSCGADDQGIHSPRLVGFDASSGVRRWTVSREEDIGVARSTMVWGSGSTDVPVDAGGVVVTPGGRGGVTAALDATTGKQRWNLPTTEGFLGASAQLVFTANPAFDQPSVLDAFDRGSGARRWSFAGTGSEWGATFDVVAADPQTVVVANGGYLGRRGDEPFGPTTFYVLDARTGAERARFTAADPNFNGSDFAMKDGLLVYAEGPTVLGRELLTGAVRWQQSFAVPVPVPPGRSVSQPVTLQRSTDSGTVFARSDGDQLVFVLDTRTGKRRWELDYHTSVRASSDGITIVSRSPKTSLRGVDTRTGHPRWHHSVPAGLAIGSAATQVNVRPAAGRFTLSTVCDQG